MQLTKIQDIDFHSAERNIYYCEVGPAEAPKASPRRSRPAVQQQPQA